MSNSCLIIGLGQIGMGYDLSLNSAKAVYTHARALSMHPTFDLAGAVDPTPERRNLFTERFKLPAFADVDEALQHISPALIVIASPTVFHAKLITEVLTLCRPEMILCEKPLAYELEDAREIVKLCREKNVKLFVNYIRRSDPGAIEIKRRFFNEDMIGPVKGVAWYSKGFMHNGSHLFNLIEFWLGKYVHAKIINDGRLWQDRDPEPDVHVKFEHGTVLFLAAWEDFFSHYTIELINTSGRLRYEQGGEYIVWQSTQADDNIKGYTYLKTEPEIISNRMQFYQLSVIEQMANEMKGKKTSLCTGEQALETLESIHNIIKLIQS